ncbi:hypothetical protein H7J06_15580 [Mycobacterium hodleri]|uniref:hypothetical protein n=1 Tax=Mycolicibacterium hodleri TaxID=49897 RepID=UPI0021F31978|nr:hypothetical protein [Mycolicibacterium hodleri]MCV7134409.1 hypothetical protein [Mycolicibacterium hodleri]
MAWNESRKSKASEVAAAKHMSAALQAAKDAAAAEAKAAEAAGRAATALEDANRFARDEVDAAERAPWSVRHSRGAKWSLHNESRRPKFNVLIAGPGVSSRYRPEPIARFDGGSQHEFWGDTSHGAKMQLTVTWYETEDGSGEPLSWWGAMPPEH